MKNEESQLIRSQARAISLMQDIEAACINRGINLTVYNGKIGFVDQELKKIVMVWDANYSLDKGITDEKT